MFNQDQVKAPPLALSLLEGLSQKDENLVLYKSTTFNQNDGRTGTDYCINELLREQKNHNFLFVSYLDLRTKHHEL